MSAVTGLYQSQSLADRVAAEVRGHAARMGLYQKDLAKALDIHPSQVTSRMRGRVAFTLDEIEILARLFGVDPADLMPRANPFRSAEPSTSTLPRLDLNQQPFGWMSVQLGGGSVVPLFAPGDPRWTREPDHATRPDQGHPFRPILVSARHLVAI